MTDSASGSCSVNEGMTSHHWSGSAARECGAESTRRASQSQRWSRLPCGADKASWGAAPAGWLGCHSPPPPLRTPGLLWHTQKPCMKQVTACTPGRWHHVTADFWGVRYMSGNILQENETHLLRNRRIPQRAGRSHTTRHNPQFQVQYHLGSRT